MCSLPSFDGATDGTGRQDRTVLGVAFPRNVVRVRLGLGELGQRNLMLRLLTVKQAQEIHVDRFRWGYVKLIGHMCLHEVRGYNPAGQLVYSASDEPSTPCQPE